MAKVVKKDKYEAPLRYVTDDNCIVEQWAKRVISYSSQYNDDGYCSYYVTPI
jgi:hypothetical protein